MIKRLPIEILRVRWVCAAAIIAFALSPTLVFAQYAVNGNASQISCNCYRLTPDQNTQSGSVWNLNQINLHIPFDFIFDVYFGTNDGGADGIGFVLQPISTTVGGGGGGMGFAGISPSWAVEMDTYQNSSDPAVDHIAIIRNGDVNHATSNTLAGPVQMSASSGNVEDGGWHQLRVVWDPSFSTMLVYFDGQLRLTQNYDIISNIFGGSPNVYWGFTAGTGGARNEHRFCVGIVPQFNTSTATACAGTPIQFTDNSISTLGPIASWNWDFGDGNTSNLQSPTHAYSNAGNYTVTLTVTDINGCTASSNYQVTITAPANANAGADVSICDGDVTNLSGSGGNTYSWNPTTGLSDPNIANPVATPATTTTYTLTVTDANGCQGTDDVVVTVNPLPTAAFDATDECFGTPNQFTDQSTTTFGTISTHAWDFGDSNTSSSQDPSHTYGQDGPYNVTLTVIATGGCTNSIMQSVTVFPQPVADFTYTDECLDTPSSFQDQSTITNGTINAWAWDFSGESSSASQNPNYAFTSPGLKNVDLTVSTADGCSSSQSYQVDVFPLPQAMFSAPDLCLGATTSFSDLSTVSTGSITDWDWDFDDNNFSALSSPSHTYANADQYDVTLIVTTDKNCVSSVTLPVIVSTNPVAGFTFVEACENDDVDFTSTSTIAVGNIDSWAWDFGDLGTSSLENPSHPYIAYGTYTVGLTVTSPEGCTDYIEQDVDVHPYPTADFSVTTECFGTPTQFTDASTVPNGGAISSWSWDFEGGGSPSSSPSPSYTYAQEGQYNATLTVSTPYSCSATVTYPVTVYAMPIAEFDNTTVCLGNTTEFENLTQINGTLASVSWDFGDNNIGSGDNPTNTYADHGIYYVTMTVVSTDGCTDQILHEVPVHPLPEVDFTSDVTTGCQPLRVQFIDLSTIEAGHVITSRVWDIGEGDPVNSTAPLHTYIQDGSYDVTLTVTSLQGCASTLALADAIMVFPKPKAAFILGPQPTTLFDPVVDFTDKSNSATQWAWNFGDDAVSTLQNPEHEYLDSGTYVVELIAMNDFDCADTIDDIVVIDPVITLFVPEAFTPNSDGINDEFYAKATGINKFKMSIFNRWGEQVFTTWDINNGWDGTLNNAGLEVKEDIYSYRIILEDNSGVEKAYKGIVTLMR